MDELAAAAAAVGTINDHHQNQRLARNERGDPYHRYRHRYRYRSTDASTPYWKVRNSWDTDWGEAGFIRLEYGSNQCGLTNDPTWATVGLVAHEKLIEQQAAASAK